MSELRREVLRPEQDRSSARSAGRFQGAAVRAERATAKEDEVEDEAVAPAGVELVSLDEVEATEEKVAEPVVDELEVEDDESRR